MQYLITVIKFKLASLTFKTTHNKDPPYLFRLLISYRPSRVLRSSFSSSYVIVSSVMACSHC